MSPFLPALPAEPTLKGTCLVREFFSFGFASLPKRSFQLEFFFFKTTGNPPSDIGRFLSDSQSRGDRPTCHSFRPLETCSPGTSSRFGHHPSVQYQEQLLAAEADKLQDLDLPGSSSEDELPESSENSPQHQGKPPSPTSLGGPRVFASRPTYSIDSAGNARYIEPKPIVQESQKIQEIPTLTPIQPLQGPPACEEEIEPDPSGALLRVWTQLSTLQKSGTEKEENQ